MSSYYSSHGNGNGSRRVPREPEAHNSQSWDMASSVAASNSHRRPRLDPPAVAAAAAAAAALASTHHQQQQPSISLSERQLELLARKQQVQQTQQYNQQQQQSATQRQQRDPSVVMEKQSNGYHRQQQQQQLRHHHHQQQRYGSGAPLLHPSSSSSSWTRTPNPISRSGNGMFGAAGGGGGPSSRGAPSNPSSPSYLNQILKKAMSGGSSQQSRGWHASGGGVGSSSFSSIMSNAGGESTSSSTSSRQLHRHHQHQRSFDSSAGGGSGRNNKNDNSGGKRSLKSIIANRVVRHKHRVALSSTSSSPSASADLSSESQSRRGNDAPSPSNHEQAPSVDEQESRNNSDNTAAFSMRERLLRVRKDGFGGGANSTATPSSPKKSAPQHPQQVAVSSMPPPPPPPPPPPLPQRVIVPSGDGGRRNGHSNRESMTPTSSSSTLTSSASLRQQHQNQHRNAAAQQRVINDGALREKQKKKYGNNFQHPAAAESSIKPAAKKQRNTEHLAHSDGVLVAGNLRKHQRMLMESSCAEADNGDHADCDEDDEEKEPEGYRELYRSLETEVFGQHSMLWGSFHAVIKGQDIPPPRVVPPRKPIKFDDKTARILKKLHEHVKNDTPAELAGKTQLVNDKKYSKEVKENALKLPPLAAASSSFSTTGSDSISPRSDAIMDARSAESDVAASDDGAVLQTGSTASSSDDIYSRNAVGDRQSPREADDAILNIRTAMSAEGASSQAAKSSGAATYDGCGKDESGSPDAASSSTVKTVFDEATGLEVTLGQFESKVGSSVGPPPRAASTTPSSNASSSSSHPWAGIKLNSTGDSLNSSTTSSAAQLSSPAESLGLMPEWANMKLRRVKRVESEESSNTVSDFADLRHQRYENADLESDVSELGKILRQQLTSATTASESTASSGDSDGVDDAEVDESATGHPDLPEENITVGGSISSKASSEQHKAPLVPAVSSAESTQQQSVNQDKVDTPKDAGRGRKIDDEAAIVRLRDIPGTSKNDVARVIIGKQMLMVVKSEDGNPRAQVIWKLPRAQIDSLALDMATMTAKLVLLGKSNDVKTLPFSSSDDCLRFANAFYGQTKQGAQDEGERSDLEQLEIVEESSVDDSTRLEPLNEEEQNVLETYRRLRRTKGPEDALQASIPVGEPTQIQAATLLTAEEEKTASVYRRMLKMGVPLEGVEHKMKMNDVGEKVVAAIASAARIRPSNTPPQFVAADADPTSPVSAMSSSIGLSVSDVTLVEEYKKMLRSDADPGAVRHKMLTDQVDQKIVSAVLRGEARAFDGVPTKQEPVTKLSEEEEKVADSFRKMLKLKFPEEVVRHRMKKEEVDEKIVAAVFGASKDEPKSNAPAKDSSALTAEEEVVAKKYRRMLKMCIPKDAVRHKMTMEQVSQKIIDHVVGAPAKEASEETGKKRESVPAPALTQRKQQISASLSFEEESVASSYRKMLKLQIPKESVLSRMQKDGVSNKVISAVVGSRSLESASTDDSKDSVSGGSKLVSLHWTPLSGKELDNSVWRVNSKLEDIEAQPENGDISKLIALFQKKTAQKKPKLKSSDDSKTVGMAKLLDITRSNNVAISLKAFKDFSFTELAETIAFLDPGRKITGERTLFLRGLLPTAAEIKVIKEYEGSEDRLIPAELWFKKISGVQRLEEKAHVLQTMETFKSEVESVSGSFRLLSRVCNQVMDSEKLQLVLGMVLRIGNIMNEGTRTGGAAGFKFDSLLRLTQTKSSDGKITVLDFLVTVFVEKGQRSTLDLLSDFPDCHNAGRMVIGDLLSEVGELKASLAKCRNELQLLKEEEEGPKIKKPRKFGSGSAGGPANAALMAAILSRGEGQTDDEQPKKPSVFTKREEFLAAIKERSSDTDKSAQNTSDGTKPEQKTGPSAALENDEEASAPKNGRKGGIARLQQFVEDADELFQVLESTRKEALENCIELSSYLGEGGGTGATSGLLTILFQFASKVEEGLRKYDALEKQRQRLRKKCDDASTLCSEDASKIDKSASDVDKKESSSASKESLVLLVNDFIRDASDRDREEFKKGLVCPNPTSKTLQAIYKREKFGSPNAVRRKMNIVSAIRVHQENADKCSEDKELEDKELRSRFSSSSVPILAASSDDNRVPVSSNIKGEKAADNASARKPSIDDNVPQGLGSKIEQECQSTAKDAPSTPLRDSDETKEPNSSSVKKMRAIFESPKQKLGEQPVSVAGKGEVKSVASPPRVMRLKKEFLPSPQRPKPKLGEQPVSVAGKGEVISTEADKKVSSEAHSPQRPEKKLGEQPVTAAGKKEATTAESSNKEISQEAKLQTTSQSPQLPEEKLGEQPVTAAGEKEATTAEPSDKDISQEAKLQTTSQSPKEEIKVEKASTPANEASKGNEDEVVLQESPKPQERLESETSKGTSDCSSLLASTETSSTTPAKVEPPAPDGIPISQQQSDEVVKPSPSRQESPVLRLSDARKARSRFENFLKTSDPAPVAKRRDSLPIISDNGPKHNPSPNDATQSEDRPPKEAEAPTTNESLLPGICEPGFTNNIDNGSGGNQSIQQASPAKIGPDIESTPPRTLADLARAKRNSRETHKARTTTTQAPSREALQEVTLQESPVLRMARLKREMKNDDALMNKATPPPPPPPPSSLPEQLVTKPSSHSLAELARQKRSARRSSSGNTTP